MSLRVGRSDKVRSEYLLRIPTEARKAVLVAAQRTGREAIVHLLVVHAATAEEVAGAYVDDAGEIWLPGHRQPLPVPDADRPMLVAFLKNRRHYRTATSVRKWLSRTLRPAVRAVLAEWHGGTPPPWEARLGLHVAHFRRWAQEHAAVTMAGCTADIRAVLRDRDFDVVELHRRISDVSLPHLAQLVGDVAVEVVARRNVPTLPA